MSSRPARRRSFEALVCALVAVIALAACGDNAGDPGNGRLNALKSDPALKLVPPGLRDDGQDSQAASKPPFSDFYSGPGVTKSFRFTAPVEQALPHIFDFYSAELPRLGWVFVRKIPPPTGGVASDAFYDLYRKGFGHWEASLSVRFGRSSTKPRGLEEPALFMSLDAPPAHER